MPFTEDLSPFFALNEFASAATLGGTAVRGIFDSAYQLGDVGSIGFAATQPVFTLPSGSLSVDPVGQMLIVNATTYTVVAVEPDGTGITRLLLERS